MKRQRFAHSTQSSNSASQTESLIAEAQGGSIDSLGRLLQDCQQYLLLVANQELDAELKTKMGASDLVQETFLEAQRGFHRFQGRSEADLLTWLRQILLNNIRDAAQRYRKTAKRQLSREVSFHEPNETGAQPSSRCDSATQTPSWHARLGEKKQAIERALQQLPSHYREIIEFRDFDLLSFGEIGDRLSCTPDAARKLWSRAIKATGRLLDDDHEN